MESKTHINIFESAFESFELDDGFLLNVDVDLSEHEINIKDKNAEKKCNPAAINKSETLCSKNKVDDSKNHFDDASLFLEDLNESDFFEHTISKNKKTCRVSNIIPNNEAKIGLPGNTTNCCLSPVLFSNSKNKISKAFSSTPLKQDCSSKPETKKKENKSEEKNKAEKPEENLQKIPEYEYLESDLFEEWNVETESQKDFITLSQAFKLIEEAKSARQSNPEDLNTSLDLLTGRPVGCDTQEDLLTESFTLPDFIESKQKKENSDDFLIKADDFNSGNKLPEIQKLNFETKTKAGERSKNFGIIVSSTDDDDDDFDFLTQESLKKPKCVKTLSQLKGFSSDESSESITRKGKYCRIIESDSADDSPDLKFNKRHSKKKIRRPKNCKRNAARKFIELEAEVSNVVEVSSDESEVEGNYDASFVDEELYLTQNCSANMTAKYLESVKNRNHPGGFKIPPTKPYCPAYVFSQIPEDNSTEYELDSFCVNEVEDEIQTDLSDLEIAEKILEIDRKKKKRKWIVQEAVKIK